MFYSGRCVQQYVMLLMCFITTTCALMKSINLMQNAVETGLHKYTQAFQTGPQNSELLLTDVLVNASHT